MKCLNRWGGNARHYTIGAVYEVIDGTLETDTGDIFGKTCLVGTPHLDSFDAWKNYSIAEWELVG